jgi:catechol 2,3-dioxygenase
MKLGHVHIKVQDLDQSIRFYSDLFNLEVTERMGKFAFLTGNHMHHQLALQAMGENADAPAAGTTGLFHTAFEVEDKHSFAQKYQQLLEMDIRPNPVDHLISWSLYFDDPDGNGLEIYVDIRETDEGKKTWEGRNMPLPEEKILKELE